MSLSTYSAVIFVIACFLGSGSAGGPQHGSAIAPKRETVAPKWRTNLRSAIEGSPLGELFGRGREYKALPRTSLWFTDNNTIVATLITRKGNSSLSNRGGMGTALRIRPVFLDAASGKVIATLDWPSGSRDAGIIAVHDGKIITQSGDELTLYALDLKPLKRLKLPSLEGIDWDAHSSPTGESILFIGTNLRTIAAVPWIWVDTDSLSVVHSWNEVQSGWVGISDRQIAMTTCVWIYNCESEIKVRGIGADWKTVASASRRNKPHPQFVNEDLLFLPGNTTRLVRGDGEVVFAEDEPPEGCWWGRAFPSANGQRFVTPSCARKGAVAALDIGGHDVLKKILVYDAPFHGSSYTLGVKGPTIKDLTLFAVSPDGLQLAILNNDSVEVLPLPPLQ